MFEQLFDIDPDASQAQLRELVERCERLKAAADAAAGLPARRRGKGLGTEIALARRDAPNCGGQHLGFANALVHEMPRTLAALERGELSEWRATLIVRESACLSADHRRQLDAELGEEADGSTVGGTGGWKRPRSG